MSIISLDKPAQDIENLLAQFDLKMSELRDALRGADNRTLTDIYNKLSSVGGSVSVSNAYDSTNDWFKVGIKDDSVGLATEATLKSELTRLAKLKAYNATTTTWDDVPIEAFNNLKNNLDTALSNLDSKLGSLTNALDSVGTDAFRIKTVTD